jgi:large subunit ribosomal protein L32
MAVPKQRKTKSRRNQRRMHIHLDKPTLVDCPQCKEKKLMHTVCKACGYYKNREIIDVLKEKKTPKEKETEEKKKPLNIESLSKK